tara:strand:- start:176 stop:658 length:483 start_codon:yes stop_codon:yes gene_type:complete
MKNLNLSREEILELAVKVIVHPTYGWLTTALMLYGCRPLETFSLIPYPDGTGSVIDFHENQTKNSRREVLANPFDFVEKLNICDQISQPVFYENFEDYNFDELNSILADWNSWFKSIKTNLELNDFRDFWVKRIINDGISEKRVAKYIGLTYSQYLIEYF